MIFPHSDRALQGYVLNTLCANRTLLVGLMNVTKQENGMSWMKQEKEETSTLAQIAKVKSGGKE
jgi:hypothetical protein